MTGPSRQAAPDAAPPDCRPDPLRAAVRHLPRTYSELTEWMRWHGLGHGAGVGVGAVIAPVRQDLQNAVPFNLDDTEETS